ncbi:hypothetical protein OHA25_04870 [Nonomuraea sp. NBC_00507]|uniref:hypothetical protein n=1 Tax=unclassified Nonomuraea TaxID=2593643 RepID=UPI0016612BBA|nr:MULTISPECIES: hypothetical protein [unclassified Nonomuraea]
MLFDEWACVRCQDAMYGPRPDDGLCGGCLQELETQPPEVRNAWGVTHDDT